MYSDPLTAEEYKKYGYGLKKISISSSLHKSSNNNVGASLQVVLQSPLGNKNSKSSKANDVRVPTKSKIYNKEHSPPVIKLYYETPEELLNKRQVSDDYSKAIKLGDKAKAQAKDLGIDLPKTFINKIASAEAGIKEASKIASKIKSMYNIF